MEPKILRPKIAVQYTGLGRSTFYNKINPNSKTYDPDFPKPIKLGARAAGFKKAELDAWLESR